MAPNEGTIENNYIETIVDGDTMSPEMTTEEIVNPYLEQIKQAIEDQKKKFFELLNRPPLGFPERIRQFRRAKNRRSRESRRINRFLAKGKHL